MIKAQVPEDKCSKAAEASLEWINVVCEQELNACLRTDKVLLEREPGYRCHDVFGNWIVGPKKEG
jgi:hypothetical protein